MAIIYPNSGAMWGAGLLQTALAGSEIHLFQAGMGVVIGPALDKATLVAAECDYTGYASQTVAAFLDPLLSKLGGASIDSGVAQFAITTPFTVPNVVGGGWLEDAAGDLVAVWDYNPNVTLAGAGDGLGADLLLLFG